MPPQLTLSEASAQIRSGALSPVDLVDRCLDRIDQFEPRVQAWVLVDAAGARAEARRLANQRPGGPLHGIPLGIKDIVDVAGWPTRAGSPLREHHRAEHDAPLVARLRDAGAIFLGKTVTTQFASFDPPVTRNPWNLDRTPGGSSSGSAAAVALGMCLGAVGSQTGGSITRPASYCGVAGCKPALGRVPTAGLVPFAFHLDHPGPIARSVADLAVMLQVMSPAQAGEGDVLAACSAPPPPRLGLLRSFFMDECAPDARAVVQAAIERLQAAGATVKDVALPASFGQTHLHHRRIMAVEAAEYHQPWFPAQRESYGREISTLLDEGLAAKAIDYATSLAHQIELTKAMCDAVEGFDALLTPATDGVAPDRATTGNPRFNSPWSYTGQPTVSFPVGLSTDGMPMALQLIGRPGQEAALFAASAWCERQLAFRAGPPLLAERP